MENYASVATLILFGGYFIGRIIVILMEKDICYDEVSFLQKKEPTKYEIIDEIDLCGEGDTDYQTTIVLTSKQGVRDIKVFEIVYDEELNEIKKRKKQIAYCKFLNIGQSFAIKTVIPELIANYRMVYYMQDFKKVTFDISDNLKSGVASELLKPKHTIKSWVYYLFR